MRRAAPGLLAMLIWLAACSTAPEAIAPVAANPCETRQSIHVVSHGWHTGLVVKAADMNAIVPALANRFRGNEYYEIGWGDAGFYQADEITSGLTLRALLASSGSALHVVGFSTPPELRFPHSTVRKVDIARSAHANLLQYIHGSFARDAGGNIVMRGRGLYGDSEFYAGTGYFHAFNTCNKWTAKALYSAGIEIDPAFKLTAHSIIRALDAVAIPACATPRNDAPAQ